MVWAQTDPTLLLRFPDPRLVANSIQDHMYYTLQDGQTSAATAVVSGLLATYLSRDLKSANRMRKAIATLKNLAESKVLKDENGVAYDPGAFPVVWNGIQPDSWFLEDQLLYSKLKPPADADEPPVTPVRIHTAVKSRKPVPTP
ncbi:hypothetical protein TWF481_007411 [Arthrobotrys musiformis]|uniref:Uncharacterized protein n=1 Tax=Arthrobotrys musiformis TaxID=47236 RepID=A0AAV9WBF5_9PEZI